MVLAPVQDERVTFEVTINRGQRRYDFGLAVVSFPAARVPTRYAVQGNGFRLNFRRWL
jgi:hypothetical protein